MELSQRWWAGINAAFVLIPAFTPLMRNRVPRTPEHEHADPLMRTEMMLRWAAQEARRGDDRLMRMTAVIEP